MKVILYEPEISGNTGFIARVMKNFGFNELILINPNISIDEAKKYAVHAKDLLDNAKIISSIDELDCNLLVAFSGETTDDLNVRRAPITLNQMIKKFKEKKVIRNHKESNIGLVFGRESNGLSNSEIDECGFVVTIPTTDEYRSMNLSHSVCVVLYEIHKNYLNSKLDQMTKEMEEEKNRDEKINTKKIEFATKKDKELMKKFSYELIDEIVLVEHKNKVQKQVWDNIIEKSMLTKREGFNVMGFFKELKKLIKN